MEKYYKLLDLTPVYVASIVLYLGRKWKWIKKHWKAEWVQPAKDKIKLFWESKYKLIATTTTLLATAQPSTSTPKKAPNDFLKWLNDDEDDDSLADEYARYIT